MALYTNQGNVPLSMAVWLARDQYDHRDDPKHISATGLMKPLRQIILASRVPASDSIPDISSMIASRLGTAIHDSIEGAWVENYKKSLEDLGYPKRVIERVRVNPEPGDLGPDVIPIYLELRSQKEIDGYTISGKFDFVGDGRVEDFKSTSTYTYQNKTKDDDYILQGSIYRWLNPTIITRDEMAIQFIFTDWSAMRARTERERNYPQSRTLEHKLLLKSPQETEAWVRRKLSQVIQYKDAPDDAIPRCTDDELWREAPQFKYYKNPAKLSRSTKNFDSLAEANLRLIQDGSVGIVVTKPGQVKACKYCPAFPVCKQKDEYIDSGDLVL